MAIHRKLRDFRINADLTMKQVSERIGIPLSTYRDWEQGRKVPAQFLMKLAEALGVTISELTGSAPASQSEISEAIGHMENALEIMRRLKARQ